MPSLPFMPFYVSEYLADTSHLTTLEHGAYLRLIFAYWQRRRPLPSDDDKLARIAGLTPDEWGEHRDTLAEFFLDDGEAWTHGRIEAELKKAATKTEGARRAAAVRHGKAPPPDTNVVKLGADALPKPTSRNARKTSKQNERSAETTSEQTGRTADALRTHSEGTADALRTQCHIDVDRDKEEEVTTPRSPPGGGKAKRGYRIPDDFALTDSRRQKALDLGLRPDRLQTVFDRFVDYWGAASGGQARKVNWDKTWANWVRGDVDRQAPTPGGAPPTPRTAPGEDPDVARFLDEPNWRNSLQRENPDRFKQLVPLARKLAEQRKGGAT